MENKYTSTKTIPMDYEKFWDAVVKSQEETKLHYKAAKKRAQESISSGRLDNQLSDKPQNPVFYDVEQVYQLSQLLNLQDQALLLQHLAGSLASKADLKAADCSFLFRGIVAIQRGLSDEE